MQFEQNFCEKFGTKQNDSDDVTTKDNNICSNVKKSLIEIIAKEGYKTYNISTKILTTAGGNYLGELYEIDVNGKTKNGSKITHIFVKHVPGEDLLTTALCLTTCYNNELFVYNELSNIFNELYHEAAVPEEDQFKMVKFYKQSNKHALIFENLNRKGYKTLNRTDIMSLSYAKSAIKELAKFHGLSFVIKDKRKDFLEKYIKALKTPVRFEDDENSTVKKLMKNMITTSFDNVDIDVGDKNQKINEFCNKTFEITKNNANGLTASTKCLCHGDYRISNILMKENDNAETETVTIDYQLINYGSPIYDILYFIYTATDRKFRKNHMEYLKNIYHDTLTKTVGYFDLDINSIYSKSEFEKDFQEKRDFGLLVSAYFLPFFLTEDPDLIKNAIDVSDQSTGLHHSFKTRINEIFQEYIDLGLL